MEWVPTKINSTIFQITLKKFNLSILIINLTLYVKNINKFINNKSFIYSKKNKLANIIYYIMNIFVVNYFNSIVLIYFLL